MMAKACQKHDNRVIDQALSLILKKSNFQYQKAGALNYCVVLILMQSIKWTKKGQLSLY